MFLQDRSPEAAGVGVILHCFSYGRSRSRTLERECLKVNYYRRDLNLFHLFRKDRLSFYHAEMMTCSAIF